MATNITAKLNKAANIFQAGESTGFGLRLGVQYYDRETKQKEWTNYECAIFAKNPQQIQFYQSALVEGSVVEINATSEKIKKFEGQNGLSLSIELIDAKVGYVHSSQPQTSAQQQGGYNQEPQKLPSMAQQQGGFNQATQQGGFKNQGKQQANQFDDDIEF